MHGQPFLIPLIYCDYQWEFLRSFYMHIAYRAYGAGISWLSNIYLLTIINHGMLKELIMVMCFVDINSQVCCLTKLSDPKAAGQGIAPRWDHMQTSYIWRTGPPKKSTFISYAVWRWLIISFFNLDPFNILWLPVRVFKVFLYAYRLQGIWSRNIMVVQH